MNTLNFDMGVKEYTVNGGSFTLKFNPTDMSFIERVFNTFEKLDNLQESYANQFAADVNGVELFDKTREMDIAMRAEMDALFGEEFCNNVFGTMHIYAIADGLPVWTNLMLAIVDELDSSFVAEKKKTNPRIQKYISKYQKK